MTPGYNNQNAKNSKEKLYEGADWGHQMDWMVQTDFPFPFLLSGLGSSKLAKELTV